MRIYDHKQKHRSGWGFWGDYGEIDMGFSSGYEGSGEEFKPDKLHFHKQGTIYILVLDGGGVLEVEGKEVVIKKDQLLRIDPGEKYKINAVTVAPFSWITICSNKDPNDKVVVE